MGVDSVGGSSSRSTSTRSDTSQGVDSSTTNSVDKAAEAAAQEQATAEAAKAAAAMSFNMSSFEPAKDVAGMPNLMSSTPIAEQAMPTTAFDPVQSLDAMPEMISPTPLNPEPQTFVSDFSVPEGQVTFDAEGQEVEGAYFSREAHWPGGASGVTIGRGYDMKERTQDEVVSDLTAAGVPRADAELLAQGAGLTGQDAKDFIAREDVKAARISPMAQKNLFATTYDRLEADVKRISSKQDTVDKYGTVDWDNLDPALKDIAVDLRYRGDYTTKTRQEVQELLVNNDLQGMYDLLSDEQKMTGEWGVPQDRFERRRDYLEKALNGQ